MQLGQPSSQAGEGDKGPAGYTMIDAGKEGKKPEASP